MNRLPVPIVLVPFLTALAMPLAVYGQVSFPYKIECRAGPLQKNVRHLLETWQRLDTSVPEELKTQLQTLVTAQPGEETSRRLQSLLDSYCLLSVSINPEARVKAARGPAKAKLRLNRPVVFLVKVDNDAGVTAALRVHGPELRSEMNPRGWLEALVIYGQGKEKRLTGQRLQYVLLQLTAREAGKREATLKVDAGQGSQDLGFRAEVPILFTIQ